MGFTVKNREAAGFLKRLKRCRERLPFQTGTEQILILGNQSDQKSTRYFGTPHPNGRKKNGVIEGERLHVSSVE